MEVRNYGGLNKKYTLNVELIEMLTDWIECKNERMSQDDSSFCPELMYK